MCELFVESTSRGYMLAVQKASDAIRSTRAGYNFVKSKVVDATGVLFGKKVAKVTYEVLETLPFSLLVAFFPVPTITTILLVHILARDCIFDDSVYHKVPIIVRNTFAVKVLQHSVKWALHSPSSSLTKIGLWLLITYVFETARSQFELYMTQDDEAAAPAERR